MLKCKACGKFLAANDTVKCKTCPGTYHRICVNLPVSGAIPPTWTCPGCRAKIPREDNSNTPVKGLEIVESASSVTATHPEGTLLEPNPKAKCLSQTQEFIGLAKEIRSLRKEVSALRSEIREFRDEITGLKESVKLCGDRVELLEGRVTSIEEKFVSVELRNESGVVESPRLAHLEATITELKLQLNEREQESILNDIQLSGVTEVQGENSNQILHTLALKLGVELDERDVMFAKRVGNILRDRVEGETARPRVIVIRLARRAARDSLLSAARVRRGLTTADIQMPGAPKRIFVNERLTKTNRQLFYLTRQAADRLNWKYVWTKDGHILARKEEGKAVVQIRTEADIDRFFVN